MAVNDIRYRRLGYVALNVSDVARATRFYQDLVGLTLDKADNGPDVAFLRCSSRHHDIMLCKSDQPGLKRAAWEMESDHALEAVRAHLQEIGLPVIPVAPDEARQLGVGTAFRTTEPTTGATFEFYTEMALADEPFVPTHTKIFQLGHVVLASEDRQATQDFVCDELNFRVSDVVEQGVTFLRCFPNPYHHSLGVGSADQKHLHHVNFMVSDLDDVGKGLNRMKRNDVQIVYGPGKHPPSESVFLYFLDPDGITVEYSYGMEEFPEHEAREPRSMPRGIESLDYWEGRPSPGFGAFGAIELLDA